MPRCGLLSDFQVPEQHLELVRAARVVVVFQHRQQQALAEAARTQKQELMPGVFELRDAVRAVGVIVAFFDELVVVTDSVGKLHRHTS